ncbi:MAG: LuxR family transcriptional regulator, partial [Rhodococcus sp. (in: high G+C Gram-positive bacteria)]|uniref:helix-turn-helix transcriptional regulator n=1 Tax=Rhodococcus sp. TaxID=1831 RepID=UPI003BB12FBC
TNGPDVLFGRRPECARIDQLLAEPLTGASAALVITGDPGIGKTSLLRYARDGARELKVLSVSGVEAEIMFPFAALGRLLMPVLDRLGSLPAAQADALRCALTLNAERPRDRFAAYAAAFQLLVTTAEKSPTLMLVDDAQWLDVASAEALAFTARRLRAERLVLLIATRDVGGFADIEQLNIGALDKDSAAELLTARFSAEDAASRLFGPRISTLDRASLHALHITAVAAGDGLEVVLAALAAEHGDRAALESLENKGLVSVGVADVHFAHPLLRTAALTDLTPGRLRALHRTVASALTAPSQAERPAWHLAEAALGPDDAAARALEQAADHALRRSGCAGAALALERAAELSADGPSKARRFYAAANAAQSAGQSDSALRLLRKSEEHTVDPILYADIAGIRGRVELHTGRASVARIVWQAGAVAVSEVDPARAASLLATAAIGALAAGDPAGACALAREAAHSASPGDGNTQFLTKTVIGNALTLMGQESDGMRWMREAAASTRKPVAGEPDTEWVLVAALSGVTWYDEEIDPRGFLDPLLHQLRRNGALGRLPLALYVAALADSRRGRLQSGRSAAAEAAELAAGIGDVFTLCPALGCLALLDAQVGDEQSCRAHAAESLRQREVTRLGMMYQLALEGLGLLELSLNRPDRAIPHLEEANRGPSPDVRDPMVVRVSSLDLIEAYVRVGADISATMRDQLEGFAGLTLPPALSALIWRAMALVADDADYDEFFSRAITFHARCPSPFDAARTRLCYGERLRRAGRRRDAREHLRCSLDGFERIGARLWAARAATELTAAGQPAKARSGSVADALTAQEWEVARLAANGGTNREIASQLFLSVKTIEMHLGRVYRKVGVRSRTQLANSLRDNRARDHVLRPAISEVDSAGAKCGREVTTGRRSSAAHPCRRTG